MINGGWSNKASRRNKITWRATSRCWVRRRIGEGKGGGVDQQGDLGGNRAAKGGKNTP